MVRPKIRTDFLSTMDELEYNIVSSFLKPYCDPWMKIFDWFDHINFVYALQGTPTFEGDRIPG